MKATKIFALLGTFALLSTGVFYWHSLGGIGESVSPIVEIGPAEAHAEEHQEYTCSMHPFIIRNEPGDCPICQMELTPVKSSGTSTANLSKGEGKIKYWVDPNDPSYIREQPGKSPAGKDLVPVYEDEAVLGQLINIDPVTRQNMGVRTAKVSKRDLSRTIRTVGLVGYEEPKQYSVNSKIDGWVERLFVNATGDFIKKGQPLLEIYSPQLVATQEEYLLALRNAVSLENSSVPGILQGASRLVESSKKRLQYWDITDKQIEDLARKGSASKTLVLHAPYDGIVTVKRVSEGMFVKAGMELYELADISKVWVYADIYEYELPWLAAGQKAKVNLPYQNRTLDGTISTIYPYVDPKTRTVKARIDLDNSNFQLRPDMYVNVSIDSETVRDVLSIPVEAILNSGERQTVFVERTEGKFEPRLIKTGLQDEDGFVEVSQGLFAEEMVVTSAQFMLDSESTLRAAIQKMLEPEKPKGASRQQSGNELDDLFVADETDDEIEQLFK